MVTMQASNIREATSRPVAPDMVEAVCCMLLLFRLVVGESFGVGTLRTLVFMLGWLTGVDDTHPCRVYNPTKQWQCSLGEATLPQWMVGTVLSRSPEDVM